ncbi:MAG TPA: hypothetical protein VME69_01340 [Methylocella sp.]|nr:hypothetical protein [Methylocella sp.]
MIWMMLAAASLIIVTDADAADLDPASILASGVVWYAPEVKRWVKSRDAAFSSTGQVSEREESELTTFHVAPASP